MVLFACNYIQNVVPERKVCHEIQNATSESDLSELSYALTQKPIPKSDTFLRETDPFDFFYAAFHTKTDPQI